MPKNPEMAMVCPIPISDYPHVVLAHGSGGKLTHQLISKMFYPLFGNALLSQNHDSVRINLTDRKIAVTTDSYVINPLIFPGGNIGSLAIYGTVNDLAMSGAEPQYITLGFILEEGLSMQVLWEIVLGIKQAADKCHVQIVAGDTKVVDKGKGDGIFINTTGIGVIHHKYNITPKSVMPQDCIILNGDIGRHGIAVMASRERLQFESPIESDSAPVADLVLELLKQGIEIHCLRDLTRGGLATSLVEIAQESRQHIKIDQSSIPVLEEVKGACELLGFDPLYVANEGRFICFLPGKDAQKALKIFQRYPLGQSAQIIGQVDAQEPGQVTMKTLIGTHRIIDMLSGNQFPRIC